MITRQIAIPINIRRSGSTNAPYNLLLLADDSKEAIDKYLDGGDVFVVEYEAKPIAAFVLKEMNAQTMEIKNIAVAPEWQGNGIGTRILEYAIDTSRRRGYGTITVGTCDQCDREIAFYRKSGFRISGIRKNFFKENYTVPIFENGIQIVHMIMLSTTL